MIQTCYIYVTHNFHATWNGYNAKSIKQSSKRLIWKKKKKKKRRVGNEFMHIQNGIDKVLTSI